MTEDWLQLRACCLNKSREKNTENYCLSWFLIVVVTSTALQAAKTLSVNQTVTATLVDLKSTTTLIGIVLVK